MSLRRIATGLALALAIAVPTHRAAAETLGSALAGAYEHAGLLEQNRALLRAADEDVAQAVSLLQPVVNWTASATVGYPNAFGERFTSYNAGLVVELLLWDGGATRLAVDAQKEAVLAIRNDLIEVEQQVLFRAVEAYMNVRRDSAFLDLRRNNVRVITQELRAARDRFEVGEITRTDVSLAEAQLAAAQSFLAAAEGSLARSVAEYEAAVGRPPGSLQPVSPAPLVRSLEDAVAFARRNHPQILSAQHNIAVAEINVARAEASLRPRVTGSAQFGLDEDFEDSASLGLQAQGPIIQGGRLSSQIRQAMARRDATRAGLHVVLHGIEQNVTVAYANLAVARASLASLQQQVRAQQTAFRGVREEATLGARTTLDVLNAEQDLLDARANLVSAQVDEVIASYGVLFALGLLTAEHLNLGVQIYDPAAYYNLVKDSPPIRSDQGRALDRVLRAIGD